MKQWRKVFVWPRARSLDTGFDMAVKYNVMFRVDYTYENRYGNTRKGYAANVSQITARRRMSEKELVEYMRDKVDIEPVEPYRQIIGSEMTLYSYYEVK
jgi:hypothetical protein